MTFRRPAASGPFAADGRVFFSRSPYGAAWVCLHCDLVHVRYGDGMIDVEPREIRRLAEKYSSREEPACPECGRIHILGETASLAIDPSAFRDLVSAVGELLGKGEDGKARAAETGLLSAGVRH